MGKDRNDRSLLFTKVYEKYADRILNYTVFLVKNRADAEEIAQEVFVRVFRNLDKYDKEKGKWSTWIYTIARNLCYNYLKHKKIKAEISIHKEVKIGDDKIELLKLLPDEQIGAEKMLEIEELKEKVQEAIKLLPSQYKEVITLCDIHDMPHSEVALVLKCSVNAVDVKLTRARKKLVDIIKTPLR